ncbi:CG1792, partial [Drosophila busckii]
VKMSHCRTCGKMIYCVTANNLFKQPNNIMLHQIEALTGLFLPEGNEFPVHICGPCEVSLREAVGFRERIIRTQQRLMNSKSITQALQEIDLEEVEKLESQYTAEGREESKSEDDDYEEDTESEASSGVKEEKTDNPNKIVELEKAVTSTEESAEPPAGVSDKQAKPTEKLYVKLSFVANTKHTPRINWSKLTEEEIVALKRERRKRDCICELCGRHFTCPSNFKVHLLRHTGVKNYECKQCTLKFYTPHLLRRHELAHLSEKPYPCQYCGQTFADHSGRIQHERNRHTNYRPYKCNKCDKAFTVNNKLKVHMLSHSGVRTFHCEICKVSFMRRPHLAAHFRSKGHEQNAQSVID